LRQNWITRFGDSGADRLYLVYEACHAAALGSIIPLFAIYFRFAHLTLFDIALLAFIFEGTILLTEIPTGTAADLLGRVNAMRLGSGLLLVSGIIFIAGRSLNWFIAAEVLGGIGEACRSGSAEAWISHELQLVGQQEEIPRLFARRVKFNFMAGFLAMLCGGLIAQYALAAGWLLFSLLTLGAFFCAFLMIDTAAASKVDGVFGLKAFVQHTASGLGHITASKKLLAVLVLALTANFAYEGLDQYWQVFLSEGRDLGAYLFGLMTAATAAILFLTADRFVPWLYQRAGLALPVYFLGAVAVVGLVLFSLAPAIWLVLASFVIFSVARGLQEPFLTTYMTENSPTDQRATILSTQNLFSSGGEMVAALTAGVLAAELGLRLVFLVGAGAIVAGVVLFFLLFEGRQGKASSFPDSSVQNPEDDVVQ
jgi:MFS family permease